MIMVNILNPIISYIKTVKKTSIFPSSHRSGHGPSFVPTASTPHADADACADYVPDAGVQTPIADADISQMEENNEFFDWGDLDQG